jgi:hypothetical protein
MEPELTLRDIKKLQRLTIARPYDTTVDRLTNTLITPHGVARVTFTKDGPDWIAHALLVESEASVPEDEWDATSVESPPAGSQEEALRLLGEMAELVLQSAKRMDLAWLAAERHRLEELARNQTP